MEFIIQLFTGDSVAHIIFIFSLVIATGIALGSIRILGVKLGVAGVLFSGIIFGHYNITIEHSVLEFTRELGLILFVYTIGLQVGPGFFSSFKRQGFSLNMLAAFIVVCGVVITLLISRFGHVPLEVAVGMFSGATTNTPSLGAAQQALIEIPSVTPEMVKMPGLGYAVAYPFGIIGIILTMILIRVSFKINPQKEAAEHAHANEGAVKKLQTKDVKVENANLNGLTVGDVPGIKETGVVISRVMHADNIQVALADTRIYLGDILRLVGPEDKLGKAQIIIGSHSQMDLRGTKGAIEARRIIVTKKEIDGKTIEELEPRGKYGVTITRVSRAEIELSATPEVELHLSDTLVVVGEKEDIDRFAQDVGNQPKALDHPFIIPVFIGIAIGVIVGSWPISLPGMPSAVKLGLAGGPLLVAIILSRIGRIGKLIWYMPSSANFMLREFGISLFLACVGLRSGGQFIETLLEGSGLYWMACAALITVLPLLIAAVYARVKMKLNYMTICGFLAGSMTDPPALAFANAVATSSAPSVAYATVYPLVMLLRVVSAQIIVMFFMH